MCPIQIALMIMMMIVMNKTLVKHENSHSYSILHRRESLAALLPVPVMLTRSWDSRPRSRPRTTVKAKAKTKNLGTRSRPRTTVKAKAKHFFFFQ